MVADGRPGDHLKGHATSDREGDADRRSGSVRKWRWTSALLEEVE
jgi:hypothetical protein